MPVINRLAELSGDVAEWRRDIHRHPEILYDVHRTAGFVAEKLRAFGCDEVVEGIGRTGVVGVIKGRGGGEGRVIGMRSDMDALPIEEESGVPWASTVSGKMHACGHDGHTAMLLGAARYLADTRAFSGTVVVIFQPAEEGGAGGKAMVDDGLMDRFGVTEIYGMHNMPGLPVGHFAIREGALMAAADHFSIVVEGKGGHAARPNGCIDTVLVCAHIITALQSIVSRNVDPLESAVISATTVNAGDAFNIIPQRATITGTARSLKPEVQDQVERRMANLIETLPQSFGATAKLSYERNYPATTNHRRETLHALDVARKVAGEGSVDPDVSPVMGGEDFSFMLLERPGAFIFTGNGDSAGLHHPAYDFNDDAIAWGASYWVTLAAERMPLSA